jgi:hypothetical protein
MKKLLVIAVVAALASLSFGQGGGMRMFRMGGGGSGLQLAIREDVAKELALTADQKTKLQDASDKQREERRAMFQQMGGGPGGGGGNGSPPDQAAMAKMRTDAAAKEKATLSGILNADQMKRLGELRIQRQGNSAIMDPDTQSALKMTDAQKQQVSDLQKKQMEAMMAIGEKIRNQEIDRDQAGPLMEKNRKIMEDELAKIMTADQKKMLADMGGKPFTFDTSLDNQGRGGGL